MAGNGKARRWLIVGAALLVQIVFAAACPAGQSPPEKLIFAGSGTNLPIIRVLAQAFQKKHPNVTIDVPASIGSTSAVRAAADGAIAIGLVSRPLKENEKGLGLDVVTFGRTLQTIAVHPNVPEDNISYADLIDIYRGKKTSWRNGREIVVLTREPGDSAIELIKKAVPGFKEAYDESQKTNRWTTLLTDLKMNETLAKTPNAIGYSDLGALKVEHHQIKPLKVNGVAPTLKNAETGAYPFVKPLMFVYHNDKLPPAAREFLAFVRSKEGTKIMRANGYLPEK